MSAMKSNEKYPHLEKHQVLVEERNGSLTQDVYTPSHQLIADEPLDLGGNNEGPTPFEYLLGALGSCAAMTVRMYCNHKKWPLEGTTVRIKHSKIDAKDCEDCESDTGKVDLFEREISFKGPLDQEQIDRLLQIADRCPVHKVFMGQKKVTTKLV